MSNVYTFSFKTEAPYTATEVAEIELALVDVVRGIDDDFENGSEESTFETAEQIAEKADAEKAKIDEAVTEALSKATASVNVSFVDSSGETLYETQF